MPVDKRLIGKSEFLFFRRLITVAHKPRRFRDGRFATRVREQQNRIALIKKMLLFIPIGIDQDDRYRRTVKMKPHLFVYQSMRIRKVRFIKGVVDDAPVFEGVDASKEPALPFEGKEVERFDVLGQVHRGQ